VLCSIQYCFLMVNVKALDVILVVVFDSILLLPQVCNGVWLWLTQFYIPITLWIHALLLLYITQLHWLYCYLINYYVWALFLLQCFLRFVFPRYSIRQHAEDKDKPCFIPGRVGAYRTNNPWVGCQNERRYAQFFFSFEALTTDVNWYIQSIDFTNNFTNMVCSCSWKWPTWWEEKVWSSLANFPYFSSKEPLHIWSLLQKEGDITEALWVLPWPGLCRP
jgi:hypothetical protein